MPKYLREMHSSVTRTGPCPLGELLREMAAGNEAALSALYQQTVSQVIGITRSMLWLKEDAEEVVCDVYTHAWQRAKSYDRRRGSVMAWLAVMTRNLAIDRLRQRRAALSHEADETLCDRAAAVAGTSPDHLLAQWQAALAVHRALSSLSPQRRRLVDLAFFQGLTHQEIASAVGLPLGTVKSHIRRALVALQAELLTDA
jgi:RNA polymerase sigma-70 factor (ECF subfamily)